jgi:CRISPR-associated protein Csb2
MLVIELRFLTGRFHATPWGRHVNEGVPEWPPSPYRLVRALYDVWKRKRSDWPQSRVEPLLTALAASPPSYYLPPANPSHTRSFLSQNLRDPTKKQLIFDGFVTVDPARAVLMAWPDATLSPQAASDLDHLLSLTNYLGRSESWVTVQLCNNRGNMPWNCCPSDVQSEAENAEIVQVACAVTPESYQAKPYAMPSKKVTRRGKVQGESTPAHQSWMDALSWSTAELLSSRRSEPPALRLVPYLRSARCFGVSARPHVASRRPAIHGVLYALDSKVAPRVVSTLEIAERVRRKLMGIHKAVVGDPARVSPKFSGKDSAGVPLKGHQHIYIMPQDRDGDGRLDHILIVCKAALDETEQLAMDRLETIWQSRGRPDIRLVPTRWGDLDHLLTSARRFVSATPLVLARRYRRGRGEFAEWVATEICRELAHHGLPQPSRIKHLPRLTYPSGTSHRWLEFRRNRKDDQVRPGYGFELEFPEPVAGPFALGYGCHFGLGQFVPSVLNDSTPVGD